MIASPTDGPSISTWAKRGSWCKLCSLNREEPPMNISAPLRAFLGFFAAAISVLTFHQGMIGALHELALPGLEIARAPYNMAPVPPFGVPSVLNLCFWCGG